MREAVSCRSENLFPPPPASVWERSKNRFFPLPLLRFLRETESCFLFETGNSSAQMLHKVAQLFWNLEHTKADFPYKFPFFPRRICIGAKKERRMGSLNWNIKVFSLSLSMKKGDVHSIVECSRGLKTSFFAFLLFIWINAMKKEHFLVL